MCKLASAQADCRRWNDVHGGGIVYSMYDTCANNGSATHNLNGEEVPQERQKNIVGAVRNLL